MARFLTILEVSQKQAYIFSSNRLKDNITNSEVIARIMSPGYFEEMMKSPAVFNSGDNLVYAGGGHIVLEFASHEKAADFTKRITRRIHRDYPGIDVFAATVEYLEKDEDGKVLTHGDNLKRLTQRLESKKSFRLAAFHQGTFGVERIDPNTEEPVLLESGSGREEAAVRRQKEETDSDLIPEGYRAALQFEDLGGSKGDANFIAVVHIDGNAMGARVERIYQEGAQLSWEAFRDRLRKFSEAIDRDFKAAYREMTEVIARNLEEGRLDDLDLTGRNFPARRIISAGDDICYVAEGRIGLESAAAFLHALGSRTNEVDKTGYSACAGVAIVHQKYPFYRAYELAELLCSNAKRFGAGLSADGTGRDVSAIDWHIEYGEGKDTLEEIRRDYETADGAHLELRPLIVEASAEVLAKEPFRRYENFRMVSRVLAGYQSGDDNYARSKIKGLRGALKEGESAAAYYLRFQRIEDIALESYQGIFTRQKLPQIGSGEGLERKIFVETADKQQRSILFDAIEIGDEYLEMNLEMEGMDGEE